MARLSVRSFGRIAALVASHATCYATPPMLFLSIIPAPRSYGSWRFSKRGSVRTAPPPGRLGLLEAPVMTGPASPPPRSRSPTRLRGRSAPLKASRVLREYSDRPSLRVRALVALYVPPSALIPMIAWRAQTTQKRRRPQQAAFLRFCPLSTALRVVCSHGSRVQHLHSALRLHRSVPLCCVPWVLPLIRRVFLDRLVPLRVREARLASKGLLALT